MINLLDVVTPYLQSNLVSPKEIQKIKMLTQVLPPLSGAIIECRLGQGKGEVDFSLRATASDGGREAFAGCHPFFKLPSHWLTDSVWKNIRKFCMQWLNVQSPIHHHVENIWFEFDSETQNKKIPIPCVFFDVKRESKSSSKWITNIALQTLIGNPLKEKIKNNLFHYLNLLPSGSQIHYVGAMLSRKQQHLRLTLLIDGKNILSYLIAIGHRNMADKLHSELNWLLSYSETLSVSIDIHNMTLPKIGFEVKPQKKSLMILFLDDLTRKGMCTKQKKDALLNWPGQSPELNNIKEKVSLHAPSHYEPGISIVHTRRINHIKVVLQQDIKYEAKAYLYIGYGWLGPEVMQGKEGSSRRSLNSEV